MNRMRFSGAEETLLKLGEGRAREQLTSPANIIEQFPGGVNAFLDPSQRIEASVRGSPSSMR